MGKCVVVSNVAKILFTFSDYIALYPYTSSESGDLTFTEGEEILVTQKDGEWWTGSIGDRTGIFPSNYVQPKDNDVRHSSSLFWGVLGDRLFQVKH